MKDTLNTTHNLVQLINKLPDRLLKLSQTGANKNWVTHKINAIKKYLVLEMIDAKSKLWKKLIDLELNDPIKVAESPEISSINQEPWLDSWSGVMEINEARIRTYLTSDLLAAGVILKDISSAYGSEQNLTEKVVDSFHEILGDRLSNLTAGTSNHGIYLNIPEGLKIEKPLKVTVKVSGSASFFPLTFVTELKSHSKAKVLFEFISEGTKAEPCFIPMVHKVTLGNSAELELVEIQGLDASTFFFPNETIEIGKKAVLNRFILDKGARITRRAFSVDLNHTGGSAQITGVYFPEGDQKILYDTRQNHLASDTTSTLLFKGVLDGGAYALWKGNILVKEGVRGADGYQLNNTLLLNPAAHAESIPGLEISTDDVKCSHGVTLSCVDKDQLFYLQTRGIVEEEGKSLIVDGFIRAVINRIKSAELLEYVKENLDEAEPVF
ncbi:MAG: Fe-S cluster assembly protein SufD [Anaerolineaceae bacterium]|nr:Fe-S cluster assembly protein SufD [Anaerolineaceae bacterium]